MICYLVPLMTVDQRTARRDLAPERNDLLLYGRPENNLPARCWIWIGIEIESVEAVAQVVLLAHELPLPCCLFDWIATWLMIDGLVKN